MKSVSPPRQPALHRLPDTLQAWLAERPWVRPVSGFVVTGLGLAWLLLCGAVANGDAPVIGLIGMVVLGLVTGLLMILLSRYLAADPAEMEDAWLPDRRPRPRYFRFMGSLMIGGAFGLLVWALSAHAWIAVGVGLTIGLGVWVWTWLACSEMEEAA